MFVEADKDIEHEILTNLVTSSVTTGNLLVHCQMFTVSVVVIL